MKRLHAFVRLATVGLLLVLCLNLVGCSSPSNQDEKNGDSNVLKGVTIEWYTPNPPGDINDIAARLYQPFVQNYLPGTKIMVINKEGAGGILAYNEVYNHNKVAIFSGLASALFAFQHISHDEAVKYDIKDFKWLAYLDDDVRVVVTGSVTGFRSIYDLLEATKQGKILSAGTYGKGGTAWNEGVALDYSLDLGLKLIPGYNSSQLRLALLQGEVDITCGSYAMYKNNIEAGEVYPLLLLEEERSDYFHDVPTVYEVLDEIGKSEDAKVMALALLDAVTLPKLIAASPNLTDEEWDCLQTAFNKTIADPEFAQLAEETGLNIPPLTGYQISDMINEFVDNFMANKTELVAIFQDYLENH